MYSTVQYGGMGGAHKQKNMSPAAESTSTCQAELTNTGLTEWSWQDSAKTGLGSPLRPVWGRGGGEVEAREGDICLGILVLGTGRQASHQRPSVAGGLISQASRPLARHSWWAFEGDPKAPLQSKLALQWVRQVWQESPPFKTFFQGNQNQNPNPSQLSREWSVK